MLIYGYLTIFTSYVSLNLEWRSDCTF